MTKQALPAVSLVGKDTLEEFKTADKVVLVGFFDAKDTKSNTTFDGIAESMRDNFLFGATSDAELAEAEGVKQPGVVLYKQFDEGKVVFDGKFDTESLETFAKTMSVPLIGEVGPETYAGYMSVSCSQPPSSSHTRVMSHHLTLARPVYLLDTSLPRAPRSARSS